MPPSDTVTLMAFVPAPDLELSKRFYRDLGFALVFADTGLARIQIGETAFMLQRLEANGLAENLMLHLQVTDVAAWHAHVAATGMDRRYAVQVGPLIDQPWRMRDFTLNDPAGVLWRIAQNI